MRNETSKGTSSLAQINKILPHRPPFLFVDNILDFTSGKSIVTEKYISAQEDFFNGHFPDHPIMPGVLITEALAQTCGLLVGMTSNAQESGGGNFSPAFALASIDIKFRHTVFPESRLEMDAQLQKQFGGLYRFKVRGTVQNSIVANGILSLGEISPV